MFSRPVREVASTRIFARHHDSGEQTLVYSMNVGITEPTAMILPLPVPPNPGDDAIRFVDLSGYSAFFEDMHRAFPEPPASRARGGMLSAPVQRSAVLKVHQVGDFVASFVPSRAEFTRLDARFRLADDVWSKLPYDDWGFAVFQLAAETEKPGVLARVAGMFSTRETPVAKRTIHPMAFVFPRRNPRTLFFPTLHVHDGSVHSRAEFDHQLYCQPDPVTAASITWRKSAGALGESVETDKAQGLIDPNQRAFLLSLIGVSRNEDITLTPPDITLEALRPRGELWALELSAHAAYFAEDVSEPGATQRNVALNHLRDVARLLSERLSHLTREKRDEWRLEGYADDAPLCMMSSTRSMDGRMEIKLTAPGRPSPFASGWKAPTDRGRLRFGASHDQLGHAGIFLTFTELPESDTYVSIQAEVDACVEDTWQNLNLNLELG